MVIFAYFKRFLYKCIKKGKINFLIYERFSCRNELKLEKQSYKNKPRKEDSCIKREKKLHNDYWHCGDFVYQRYGLAYKQLTDEEILDYVPTYYHHKKLEMDHSGIDTIYYANKLVQSRMFIERTIPSATNIAYFDRKKWRSLHNDEILDIVPIIEKLLSEKESKIFIKPVDGQGGSGIYVLRKFATDYVLNGKVIDINKLSYHLNKAVYLMQEGLVQSTQVMRINSSSVNTLRVIVQRENDRMVMKTCSMRLGQNGADIDNSCQGGICIKINVNNGQFDEFAKSRFDGIKYSSHPDSGFEFKDKVINNWDVLKRQIEDIATKLIEFKNIALDIAVTEEGAKLIEFNFRYGIEHQQCVLGGVRRLLNITNK